MENKAIGIKWALIFFQLMDAWKLLWEYYLRTDFLIVQLPKAGLTDGMLPLALSCFPALLGAWFSFQVSAASRGAWSSFSLWEVTQGLQGNASIIFKYGLDPLTTNVRELQSHFKQGWWDSHCTMPLADFNRCPTSFKRDHYQFQCYNSNGYYTAVSICFFIKLLPLPCGHHSLLPTC